MKGKKKGEEIKVIIEEVKDEIEDFSYRTVDKIIEKALDKLRKKNMRKKKTLKKLKLLKLKNKCCIIKSNS